MAALVAAVALPVWACRTDTPLQEAALAWDRGDYTAALKIYLQVLDSSDAASALEPIALQTGELYKTTELTDDGELPGGFLRTGTTWFTRPARECGAPPSHSNHPRTSPPKPSLNYRGSARRSRSTDRNWPICARRQQRGDHGTGGTWMARCQPSARSDSMRRQVIANDARLVVREIATGAESSPDTGHLRLFSVLFGSTSILVTASASDEARLRFTRSATASRPSRGRPARPIRFFSRETPPAPPSCSLLARAAAVVADEAGAQEHRRPSGC